MFVSVRVCPDASDGVGMLCHEQRRVDASFTWQLQGSSDVSESAEALIRTGVNHCSGNPEDIEAAWGEVARRVGGFTAGGLQLYSKGMLAGTYITTSLFISLSNHQLFIITERSAQVYM